jgi:hypothetical protein
MYRCSCGKRATGFKRIKNIAVPVCDSHHPLEAIDCDQRE